MAWSNIMPLIDMRVFLPVFFCILIGFVIVLIFIMSVHYSKNRFPDFKAQTIFLSFD